MLSGTRLSELIVAGPLTGDRVLCIGAAAAEAVAAVHAQGRVLGALSPATVFVMDGDRIHLLDSAEAALSARQADDVAALGVLLYAMATGKTPFAAMPGGNAAPPSPVEFNPRLPSGLVQVIRRAAHTDAAEKFRSAAALAAALHEVRRAPGSLESLLPTDHISSSSRVTPPPRPAPDERVDEDEGADADDAAEQARGLPF